MTFDQAKQAAIQMSQIRAGRVYVALVDQEWLTMSTDDLARFGLAMLSPSPVVGFAEGGAWVGVKKETPGD